MLEGPLRCEVAGGVLVLRPFIVVRRLAAPKCMHMELGPVASFKHQNDDKGTL